MTRTPSRRGGGAQKRTEPVPETAPHRASSSPEHPGGTVLSKSEADKLAALLKAVADPIRLQLLSMISASESGEMCVCDLTEPVGVSQPTVSHHLRVLTQAGLLTRERRASWVWYRVVPDALEHIRTLLP